MHLSVHANNVFLRIGKNNRNLGLETLKVMAGAVQSAYRARKGKQKSFSRKCGCRNLKRLPINKELHFYFHYYVGAYWVWYLWYGTYAPDSTSYYLLNFSYFSVNHDVSTYPSRETILLQRHLLCVRTARWRWGRGWRNFWRPSIQFISVWLCATVPLLPSGAKADCGRLAKATDIRKDRSTWLFASVRTIRKVVRETGKERIKRGGVVCVCLWFIFSYKHNLINGPAGDIASYSFDAVIHGGGGMSELPFVSETLCLCFDVSVEFCPLPSPSVP